MNYELNAKDFINFGWRGWEGNLPTIIRENCPNNQFLEQKTIAFYDEAIKTQVNRLSPLISYYHHDPRLDKFNGTALTGVQFYRGNEIPALNRSVIFTDFANRNTARGVLGYKRLGEDSNDFGVLQTDNNFPTQSAYFVSLGTNNNQTRLFLGVYNTANVTDLQQGTVYEIMPTI
jgi:hypothetical protein